MKKWLTPNVAFFLVLLLVFHFHACMGTDTRVHKKEVGFSKSVQPESKVAALRSATLKDCDSSKWMHVYDPDRLQVLDRCKIVSGTITERNADPDGDEHMLLKLDKGQQSLLLKKNMTKKEGALVVEVVCVNNITRKRAMSACNGYLNDVQLPAVGDRVRVTGSYVIDSHNGWTEIHPVTKIERLD